MREIINTSIVKIIGINWYNALIAAEFNIDDIDDLRDQEGGINRESIENWLYTRLQFEVMLVYDLYVDLHIDSIRGDLVIDWENSKSSEVFSGLLYPEVVKEIFEAKMEYF